MSATSTPAPGLARGCRAWASASRWKSSSTPIEANRRTSTGSFGWDGAFGTHFWVDPKEQLIGVLMVQTSGTGVTRDFENAVMQAIVD